MNALQDWLAFMAFVLRTFVPRTRIVGQDTNVMMGLVSWMVARTILSVGIGILVMQACAFLGLLMGGVIGLADTTLNAMAAI